MLEDMSYTIRAAVDADVPAIADIYNEAVIRGGASADLEPVSLESRRAWVTPISTCQVSGRRHQRSRSAVVGFGSLSKFHQRAGYDGIAELSYYIAGDHQCQGLGTMMVRWLIDAAAERGFTHVTAIIYATTPAPSRSCGGSDSSGSACFPAAVARLTASCMT